MTRLMLAAFAAVVGALVLAAQVGATPLRLTGLSPIAPSARPLSGAPLAVRARAEKARVKGVSLTPSREKPYWACPESTCEAIIDPAPVLRTVAGRERLALPAAGPLLEGGGEKGGLDPENLESAYKIPTTGGAGQTVALVDAFGYTTAEEDLAIYRKRYGLPPCTKENGCFHKVNQAGEEANYPPERGGWEGESALDMEMVSAACPSCHIMLAEADSDEGDALAETVNTAVRLGATEVSNSYGLAEQYCGTECEAEAPDYEHEGVMITASGGDGGYDNYERGGESPNFPAGLPSVVAVGGTNLRKASNARGWEDTVWSGGGSGCTAWLKPPWQHDTGCAYRMDDDIAAVASCQTPVSAYSRKYKGWGLICGTSASSPLVAGIEAHASEYSRSLPGADAFYNDPAAVFDVTSGSNGTCTPPESHAYYCNAGPGYDGPTGNGVPDGPLELTSPPAPSVSTLEASGVSGTSATLNGRVDQQGAEVSYHFEYGTSISYGASVPVPDATLQASKTNNPVSQSVGGLTAGSTYHYRLVASDAAGTVYGADQAFTMAAPTVTNVTPAAGPDDGGTTVTITGANLSAATAVSFGAREAESFQVTSGSSITAVSPPGIGEADVTVTTPYATSEASPGESFAYAKLGPVLAWGKNEYLLGDAQKGTSRVPVEVDQLPEATDLAAGDDQSVAVLGNGAVMSWGGSDVGNGSLNPSSVPVHVCAPTVEGTCADGPYLEEATQVAAGRSFSLALLKDGKVVAWGFGPYGQLGIGNTERSQLYEPGYVCLAKVGIGKACGSYLTEVVSIAAGGDFSLALLKNGTVAAWGANNQGQLGTGKKKGPHKCIEGAVKVPCSAAPVAVKGLKEVVAVAAGDESAVALLKNGTVKTWGAGGAGELGDGESEQGSPKPVTVCATGEEAPCAHALGEVTAVTAGEHEGAALLRDGSVYTWGENYAGDLGDGSSNGPETCQVEEEFESESCARTPVAVSGLDEAREIAGGEATASMMVVTRGGQVLTWGANGTGQLGDAVRGASSVPTHVCAAFATGPCPEGPYLSGDVGPIAAGGQHDLVGFLSSGPAIEALTPATGAGAGGTLVTITGSGLEGASAVDFGTTPAADFEVRSASEIIAVAPPGSGTVEVTVTTPTGTTPSRLADRFTYEDSTVTAVSPATGPGAGGTSVTITGTKLSTAKAVSFGDSPAREFEVRSAGEIVAVAPPGRGTVNVLVSTSEGTTATSSHDEFSYEGPPTVTTLEAAGLHLTSAELRGTVNPESSTTACHFEWGTSASYGNEVPCLGKSQGAGHNPSPVAVAITGLEPGTTYHFRLVASNGFGTTYGEDRSFSTPTYELPEIGRCEQLATASGRYATATCTTTSSGEDTGSYEWRPGPGAHPGFSDEGKTATLQTEGGVKIKCSSSALRGDYTSARELSAHLTLSGCAGKGESPAFPAIDGKCQSVGAAPGEIRSGELAGRLGIISDGSSPSVGWELGRRTAGSDFVTFECEPPYGISVMYSAIGVVTALDEASSSFALEYEGADGVQAPKEFEDGTSAILRTDTSADPHAEEWTVLTLKATLTGEESLEIKALP
ncbi:MAG: IPT/TIG domain-containing protein [Solirubrobacteraceae bacterium]